MQDLKQELRVISLFQMAFGLWRFFAESSWATGESTNSYLCKLSV